MGFPQFLENPVTTEIIRNAFISAANEMNESMFRSAYSPVIYEGKDCAVGIFDAECRSLGQSAGLPIFLGNLEVAIKAAIEFYGGSDYFSEGDVYIINDSYSTGTHLNDMTVFSPVFYQGQLVGYTASRAHWLDIGCKDVGFTMDSTCIFQEGMRIPPVRLIRQGELCRDVAEMICRNSRFYHNAYGDMFAQVAASRTGEKRMVEIIDRFGYTTVLGCIHDIFLQSELMEKEALTKFPEGVFRAEGCLDSDGYSNDPVEVKLTLTIKNKTMNIDLTGSSPQVAGPTNCGLAQTISACRVAYKSLIHPEMSVNGGSFRPLTVTVPEGTIFSATEPAAVNFYYSPLGLLIDLVAKALETAAPERIGGAHYGDSMLIHAAGIDPRPGRDKPFLSLEPSLGGYGGGYGVDGQDALINVVNGDLKMMPVEVYEYNYPLKIVRYSLRPDSAGAGRFRGGVGTIREYEVLYSGTSIYLWLERSKTLPWGVAGGKAATGPLVRIEYPNGRIDESILKANNMPLPPGTHVTLFTSGGGGYGDPQQRKVQLLLEDVREGYLSREYVLREYGLDLMDEDLTGPPLSKNAYQKF